MRENRMLRLTRRGLETESRSELIRAHHTRKGGNRRSRDLRITAPVLDPTGTILREGSPSFLSLGPILSCLSQGLTTTRSELPLSRYLHARCLKHGDQASNRAEV